MIDTPTASRRGFVLAIVAALIVGGVAGWGWHAWRAPTPAQKRTAMEQVVRDYILTHPEILPQAMENLQKRNMASALSSVRAQVEKPFPGAVLGNPRGKFTLVEFTDYACGYCRHSVADVQALIAANPELRVVVRDLPILSDQSAAAARMALAAAEQGKYAAFHDAMFAAGRPDPATIEAAARSAGLDLDRARRVAAEPRIEAELQRNLELASRLGFNGTPSWVAGNQMMSGAVGKDRLAAAIAASAGG